MKYLFCKTTLLAAILVSLVSPLLAQNARDLNAILTKKFDLVPKHSNDPQYYEMTSTLQKHAPNGDIISTDIYRLSLRCIPNSDPSKKDEYTCMEFTVQLNNAAPVSIPALKNWKYLFAITANNRDSIGGVFGIDHGKFENMKDENGRALPLENTYHIYNAFIDFHAMSVFAEKTKGDSGIQNMSGIGDKIVHAASFSRPPVNLGSGIAEGSYFNNGEITLLFKGLGFINKKNCAIIEYDSGKSSFYMLIKPMPTMEIPTKGSSHYWGDIYKDLSSGWIQKAILHELVISETTIAANNKVSTAVERTINIENVKR